MRSSARAVAIGLIALLGARSAAADEKRGLQLAGGVTLGDDLVGQRTALCVGINGYRDYERLRFATADARALGKALESQGYAVTLMVDDDPTLPPERVPTYRNLDDAIHRICRASRSPNDTLLVCFSGHGDLVDGQSALLPLDHHEEGRVVTLGALFDALGRAQAAKKLLVLDACRSGKRDGARLLQRGFLTSLGAAGTTVVLSGCGADESSYEDEALGMGRLTKTLVDGLGGEAFDGEHEFLYGHELWGYVSRTFRDRGWTRSQSPTMFGTWDARVRFELARREVPPPPPLTGADRAMYDLALKSAFERVEADDLTACVEYCGTALRILAGDHDALSLRAFAYAMLGFYERALADVRTVLAKDPNDVYAIVIHCFVADALGDPSVFARDGTRALLFFRADPERWIRRLPPKLASYLWVSYAVALIRLGRPPREQLEALDRVLAIPGASPKAAGWAHTLRGQVLLGQNRGEEALAEFGKALERAAIDAEVTANATAWRGLTSLFLGRGADAARDFDVALAGPEHVFASGVAWSGKAMLALRDGRVDDAVDAYRRVEALGEAMGELRGQAALGRGRIHRDRRQWAEAVEAFTAAVNMAPVVGDMRAWALLERGAVKVLDCRYEEGLQDIEAALAVPGAPPLVRAVGGSWKGGALDRLGRHEESPAAYRAVAEMADAPAGEVGGARVRLALCRLAEGDLAGARESVESGLAQAEIPVNLRVLGLVVLSRLEARSGAPEAAEAALTRASALEGLTPALRRTLEMERAALLPGAVPPTGEGPDADWSRVLFHLARREWEACERACAAARARGFAPPDVHAAVEDRWHHSGEPAETEVIFAWMRTGWTQDDDVRRVLRAYAVAHPQGPLAARAARILEEMGAKAGGG